MVYNPYLGSPATAAAPTLDSGLLSGAFTGFSPLTNFGLGLLSQSGPSLTPQSPFAAIGRAAQFTSEAQQQAVQNELIRQKLSEAAKQRAAEEQLQSVTGGITPPAGFTPEAWKAVVSAYPEVALKAVIPQALSPTDQVNLLLTQGQIAKLLQEQGATGGQAISESTGALGNVKSIATASERLDQAGSLFQPGGIIDKFGGLDLAAAGLTGAETLGYGGEEVKRLVNQVTDAQTVSKATAALAQGLQGAAGASSRSAYALRNIQTALGQNMIWPAKRRILVQNLQTLFVDAEAQGLDKKIPDYQSYKDLYSELKTQDEAFTKRNQPPSDTSAAAVPPPAGTQAAPALIPPAAAQEAPAAAPAAPPAQMPTPPPIRGVKTSDFGMDPYTNQPAPRYRSAAEAEKAAVELKRKGVPRVIVVDPTTGVEYLYEVQ